MRWLLIPLGLLLGLALAQSPQQELAYFYELTRSVEIDCGQATLNHPDFDMPLPVSCAAYRVAEVDGVGVAMYLERPEVLASDIWTDTTGTFVNWIVGGVEYFANDVALDDLGVLTTVYWPDEDGCLEFGLNLQDCANALD